MSRETHEETPRAKDRLDVWKDRLELVWLAAKVVIAVTAAIIALAFLPLREDIMMYTMNVMRVGAEAETAREARNWADVRAEEARMAAEAAREEWYKTKTAAIRKGCRIREVTTDP